MLNLINITLIIFHFASSLQRDTLKPLRSTHSNLVHYTGIKQHPLQIPHPPKMPFRPLPASLCRCIFSDQYTPAQRLRKYPYSEAAKIVAVSFPQPEGPEAKIVINDPKLPKTKSGNARIVKKDTSGLNVINGILDTASIKESIVLSSGQVKRLTFLILNTSHYPPPPGSGELEVADPGHKCIFSPRHALLFYDKNGKIFDYLEICFQCEQFASPSDRITIGDLCPTKYNLLKSFFKKIGLTYHLNDNNHD